MMWCQSLSTDDLCKLDDLIQSKGEQKITSMLIEARYELGIERGMVVYNIVDELVRGLAQELQRRERGNSHYAAIPINLSVADVERILSWLSIVEGEGFSEDDDYRLGIKLVESCPQLDSDYIERYKQEASNLPPIPTASDIEFTQKMKSAIEYLLKGVKK